MFIYIVFCLFNCWICGMVSLWGKVKSAGRCKTVERNLVLTSNITSDKRVQHHTIFQNWHFSFKVFFCSKSYWNRCHTLNIWIFCQYFMFLNVSICVLVWQNGLYLPHPPPAVYLGKTLLSKTNAMSKHQTPRSSWTP